MSTDWKKLLNVATQLLESSSPWVTVAYEVGKIGVDAYNNFEATRKDVARYAKDGATVAEIDALDDQIQALTTSILSKK